MAILKKEKLRSDLLGLIDKREMFIFQALTDFFNNESNLKTDFEPLWIFQKISIAEGAPTITFSLAFLDEKHLVKEVSSLIPVLEKMKLQRSDLIAV